MEELTVSAEDQLATLQAERLHPSMQKISELFPESEQSHIARDVSQLGAALAAAVVNKVIDQSSMDQMTETFASSVENVQNKEGFANALSAFYQATSSLLNAQLESLLQQIRKKVEKGSFSQEEKGRLVALFEGAVNRAAQQPIATIFGIGELTAFYEADFSGTPEKAADMARLLEILQADLAHILNMVTGA